VKIGVILPAAEADGPGETPGWPAIRSFARAAEAQGLDSVWMFDHLFDQTEAGSIRGMHEAWTIVSAVAASTERVEIGTLVLCTSFRSPGLTAKMAVSADEVSAGRVILGLGAGWHDPEYDAFGFPKDHRVARFEESLRIIGPLLRGERVTWPGATTRRVMPDCSLLLAAGSRSSSRGRDHGCCAWPPGMPTRGTRRGTACRMTGSLGSSLLSPTPL